MKLDPTDTGFAIEARELAALFDLPTEEVRAGMQQGRITSRFERGEDVDAGRFRLTFLHGNRRVQLTVDARGEVLMSSRVTLTAPPSGAGAPEPRREIRERFAVPQAQPGAGREAPPPRTRGR